jgi:hypothetical protein
VGWTPEVSQRCSRGVVEDDPRNLIGEYRPTLKGSQHRRENVATPSATECLTIRVFPGCVGLYEVRCRSPPRGRVNHFVFTHSYTRRWSRVRSSFDTLCSWFLRAPKRLNSGRHRP